MPPTSEDQESELKFKPLSEGLGFHPFSNGLPYSPASLPRRDISQGTGAVAAGRPSFAFPLKPASLQKAAPNSQTTSLSSGSSAASVASTVTAAAIAAASAPTMTLNTAKIVAKSAPVQEVLGWDYLGKRFFAFFVDSIINISLGAATLGASVWKEDMSPQFFLNPSVLVITFAFLLFFNWALITAQEVAFGTSIGKKFFGLSLEATALRTVTRAFLFIPSFLFLGIGVLWTVLDQNRRGLHDILSGVQPEEISQRPWEN